MIGKTSRMTVRDLLPTASSIDRLDAEVLLGYLLKKDRAWMKAHDDVRVTSVIARKFRELIVRRERHEPIAHLIREKEFYGRPFFVSKHTLIPRPETELMVERALSFATGHAIIWDVGTGSGAIGVTLACECPNVIVLATDVSSKALRAAKVNAKRHHAASRMTFLKSNLLQPAAYRWLKRHAPGHKLIITANLPYLPASDKKTLAPDVVKYEPSLALFSGDDGLTLINRFLGQLSRHASEWRYGEITILLEFDPPQSTALKKIVKKLFPNAEVTIHRDLAKRNRLLEISISEI